MSSNLFPAAQNSADKGNDDTIKKDRPYKIFFKDLFLFKENEMAAKTREKAKNRSMKIHQKSTFSSRMKSRSHLSQIAYRSETSGSFEKYGLDPSLILRLTDGSDTKRSVHEFINDQRDRFLLEYTLATKRNTIKKFEKHIVRKERQLTKAEKKLQDDAMAFEEFLRENDQRSVDALKIAAQETINKLQMTAELKKATMEVQAVKSEISKAEFLLSEYMKYGFFLLKLSPKHWQIQQALKRTQAKNKASTILPKLLTKLTLQPSKKEDSLQDSTQTSVVSEDSSQGKSPQAKSLKRFTATPEKTKSVVSSQAESITSEDSSELALDDTDFELEPVLYFKEPEELLAVLTELEEQNLTLVQYSQDVDENLEDVNKREKVIQDKMLREEKLKEKQKHQEERLKAALERAVAQPKKKLGRRLMHRSKPPSGNKRKLLLGQDTRSKIQEEEFFFT
ncbi:coiled-coil domain-containing protein 38 isoform X4 [Nycticebus coucang]|uniref:coiled-coil domain-containing protein 38 isoform X4 n=1 Tax=Nycticebus coucang TaxID=9470 RepID=UPI00234C4F19|nr:coiled-coil domain-containing protein 38 isoform X4 [Nycticebus coucang]